MLRASLFLFHLVSFVTSEINVEPLHAQDEDTFRLVSNYYMVSEDTGLRMRCSVAADISRPGDSAVSFML